jgi:hypothetical protein
VISQLLVPDSRLACVTEDDAALRLFQDQRRAARGARAIHLELERRDST